MQKLTKDYKKREGKSMNYGNSLRDISRSLNSFKANLNNDWQAEEMQYINNAIDSINRELLSLAANLDSLSSDISYTAQEIRREDEARAAAAAVAREAKIRL